MDSGFRRPHGRTGLRSQASESALVGRKPELARLEELLAIARGGGSGVLVVHGDPGVGKSALLDQLIASASGFEVVRASGVEGEVDLPYAGLHQLCRSMTDTISALPQPQSDALSVAFGRSTGDAPDRYVVGLATLSLMSEVAATKPGGGAHTSYREAEERERGARVHSTTFQQMHSGRWAGVEHGGHEGSDDTRGELTAQESQIAQLAAEGMTNPEIGAKLFLSPRTIEWHLRNVYSKLGVDSRRELPAVLSPT